MNHLPSAQFFLDANAAESKIKELSQAINRKADFLAPYWLAKSPTSLFQEDEFIVCGSRAWEEIKVLARIGKVSAIVDDTFSKEQSTLFGIPVITTGAWIDRIKANPAVISVILVTNMNATGHFLRQCAQHDFKFIMPLEFLWLLDQAGVQRSTLIGRFFRYGLDFFESTKDNIPALLAIPKLFCDEFSRISFLNLVLYRLTLNPLYLAGVAMGRGDTHDYNAYLHDKTYLRFSDDEVVVDAGAFTGDSIETYLRSTHGRFKHIYAFEPSRYGLAEIRKRLARIQPHYMKRLDQSISIIEKGVWDSTTDLHFSLDFVYEGQAQEAALGAHFIDSGLRTGVDVNQATLKNLDTVPVTTIDEATNGDATFIKFEVEGSELKGLMGATKTIMHNKPKIAVAVYHKPEDFITIPEFISSLDRGYKLGFRQHDLYTPDATYLYCY